MVVASSLNTMMDTFVDSIRREEEALIEEDEESAL